jgi:hypothetical protein
MPCKDEPPRGLPHGGTESHPNRAAARAVVRIPRKRDGGLLPIYPAHARVWQIYGSGE